MIFLFQVQKPTGEESIEGTGSMTTPSPLARSLSPRGRGRGRGAPPRRSRSPGPKPRSAERDGGPGNQLQGKVFQYLNFIATQCRRPYIFQTMNSVRAVAEFKEFERRFKFKPRFKYGWFHLKLYQMFQDLSRSFI